MKDERRKKRKIYEKNKKSTELFCAFKKNYFTVILLFVAVAASAESFVDVPVSTIDLSVSPKQLS